MFWFAHDVQHKGIQQQNARDGWGKDDMNGICHDIGREGDLVGRLNGYLFLGMGLGGDGGACVLDYSTRCACLTRSMCSQAAGCVPPASHSERWIDSKCKI